MRREGYSLYEPSIYENHSGLLDINNLPSNQATNSRSSPNSDTLW